MPRHILYAYQSATFVGLLLVIAASPAAFATVDDFSDGDYMDGSPILWASSLPPFDRGMAQIDNGDLVLAPTNESPSTYDWEPDYWEYTIVSDELFLANSTMHIQFRTLAESGASLTAISLRDTTIDNVLESTSVYGFFYKDDFANVLRLGYSVATVPHNLSDLSVDLSPFDEDLHLRLSLVDNSAEMTIWSDGQPEPELPTISSYIPDDITPMDGRIGLTAGSRLDTVPTAFRFVEVLPIVDGDVTWNGLVDQRDIDRMSAVVRDTSADLRYDLNHDGNLSNLDREFWVIEVQHTWFGDANLDGEFNSSDLVGVFQVGQYEDSIEGNAGWASGDWDGDADFTTTDLVLAFQGGGYDKGPRANRVVAVPEPTSLMLLSVGVCGLLRIRAGR